MVLNMFRKGMKYFSFQMYNCNVVFYYLVVCYLTDRNELRSHVIEWLQSEVEPDGWFSKGSNFSDVLLKYFQVCVFKYIDSLNAKHMPSYLHVCLILFWYSEL